MTPDGDTTRRKIDRVFAGLYALGLFAAVLPLWVSHELPFVDLPQHLHLISVLHRISDVSTIYPELFARRPELTPYLGYYYAVSLLNWLVPLELANRLFLTAYVAGLPLSLAFLLRSLKRPVWPSLLAVPFAYGDSLAWGFINYVSALPLTFLTCGFFIRAIADVPRRRRWALALGFCLVAVLLFHVQAFAYLAFALPFLLLTTPAVEGPKAWKARVPAVLGVVPGVVLFILWVGVRVGAPAEVAPGQPWKSWGPMLSEQNLSWKTFDQNVNDLVPTLAGMLRDGSDATAVFLALAIAGLALLFALAQSYSASLEKKEPGHNPAPWFVAGLVLLLVAQLVLKDTHFILAARVLGLAALLKAASPGDDAGPVSRWRLPGLALLALVLFFALPFDIRGYMYYLNTRYAHLIAALAVCLVPPLAARFHRPFLMLATLAACWCGFQLSKGFMAFDTEAKALDDLIPFVAPKPKVMGLIYQTASRAMTHPVYLHASTVLARARGGVTNFSFALTPHSPLMYRSETPPTFPSEWRPDQMNWDTQGVWYDHFVGRGASPRQIFGARLDNELVVAAQSGDFWLVRKR